MKGRSPINALIVSLSIVGGGCAYKSQPAVHMDAFDLTTLPESERWDGPGPCNRVVKYQLIQVRIGVPISSASAPVEDFIRNEFLAATDSCQGLASTTSGESADFDVKAVLVEWDRDLEAVKRTSGSYVVKEKKERVGAMAMEFIVTRHGHEGPPAKIVKQATLSDSDSSVYSPLPAGTRTVVRSSEGEAIRQMCREAVSEIRALVCR